MKKDFYYYIVTFANNRQPQRDRLMTVIKRAIRLSALALSLFFLLSCGAIKRLSEGETILKENLIYLINNNEISTSSLNQYIKQQPNNSFLFGLNPFQMLYNIKSDKENRWNRFLEKVGSPPTILDSSLVESSSLNLKKHLTTLGYYNSNVYTNILTKRRQSSVIYTIECGKSYILDSICFTVRDTNIGKELKSVWEESLLKKGEKLSERLLDKESERVTQYLRNRGYYTFSKNHFFFRADTLRGGEVANLRVSIENFTRNETPKDSKPHQKFRLRGLKVYSEWDPVAQLAPEEQQYNVTHLKDFDLYSPTIPSIKGRTLAKMNTLRRGSYYSEEEATRTYERLISLRYFAGVNIQFDEVPTDSIKKEGEVDCTIRVTPSKNQGCKFNFETSINSNRLLGFSPALSYYHKNLFRGGEWLTLGFMGNFQYKLNEPISSSEFGISTSLSIPSFLLVPDSLFRWAPPRTDINVSYNYQNRDEFTRNLISFSYGYNWGSHDKFFFTVTPLQLNVIKLFNLNPLFYESLNDPFLRNSYRNHFDLGAGATFYYTTDPSLNPKSSFFYLRWSNDISGNILSILNSSLQEDSEGSKLIWNTPYAQYLRSDLSLGYTWKPNRERSLATRFNFGIGFAYGNSKVLPFEKLFYAGGAGSMRGWQPRTVGPGSMPIDTTFAIPNQSGDMKIEANIEYRYKMFWSFEGALFLDVGNIWTLSRQEQSREEGLFRLRDFHESIAANCGVGLRLDLDFVILRLDLGLVIRDPHKKRWVGPKDWFKPNTYALQFGVGYPF